MPYIDRVNREELEDQIDQLSDAIFNVGGSPGDLNYVITTLLVQVLTLKSSPSYTKINEAIGVLECVKLELYRRLAASYEDKKIQENGDIDSYENLE